MVRNFGATKEAAVMPHHQQLVKMERFYIGNEGREILAFGKSKADTNLKSIKEGTRAESGSKKNLLAIYVAGGAIILIISVAAYMFICKKNKI